MFFRHFRVAGLDKVSIHPKPRARVQETFDAYNQSGFTDTSFITKTFASPEPVDTFTAAREVAESVQRRRRVRNIRIASWALDGFNATKLGNSIARRNLVRVIRQFDVIALQQISSEERDLIPRLADEANEAGRQYDYVMSDMTGPTDRREQLAFIFDVGRIKIDRSETYSVDDPSDQMLYDPLVAWFQTTQLPAAEAWTFSLVNVRVDLSRAPQEVALLPNIMSAVRMDGRGEDDVVMAGLFQADDDYLLPTIAGDQVRAAVRIVPTDIFGRHQTSNVLMDTKMTSEYIGRGGAFNWMRVYNLNAPEAETLTSHLPVFAEFTAHEGGQL